MIIKLLHFWHGGCNRSTTKLAQMIALRNYKQESRSNTSNNTKAEEAEELFIQKKLDNGLVVFDFDIDKILETMESLVTALCDTELV